MTVHLSVRSISALLLLSVSLVGLSADALAQSVADIGKKTPVTTDTPFFIGSATKAFTATLVRMLVDEGLMRWDDPGEKHLPEFKVAVRSNDPNDRATLRDVLSHRTGLARMAILDMSTGMSSDEILRRASSAEAIAPFRQQFLYNIEHYLAAGSAAGVAAGTSLQLESAGLPPTLVAVDAETGDVVQTRQTFSSGDAGAIAVTTTYSDYREVGGMRVPHSYIESNEMAGRAIYQVERVEVGVELAADTFPLQPPAAPGRGR